MAKKIFDDEVDALQEVDGINPEKLVEQVTGEKPDDPVDPDPNPQDPADKDPQDPAEPVKKDPVDPNADPAPQSQDVVLKEIFGERFKTVADAKNANIPGLLDEVQNLRQEKADLTAKLDVKPKTNFVNDEVALFNEFVRETGISNYGVFQRISGADVANMDPMDALITKHILDHPHLAGKEQQVRKLFEKKYNVDPDQVEDEETLQLNKLEVESDGGTAIKALQELKGKLKVPEPTPDEPQKPKELTPEEKTTLQTGWNGVGKQVSDVFSKLSVPIKNGKDPLLSYEISEDEQKEIQEFISNYAVENRMELNPNNVKLISAMVRNQLVINKLPEIVHSVFEKARSLTEEEVHSLYEHPSPDRNNDTPPVQEPKGTDKEKLQEDIFNAEMGE